MYSRSLMIAMVLALLGLVGGVAWGVVAFVPRPQRPEYALNPFHPVGKDYPRILPVQEWPQGQDTAAWEKYRAEQQKVRKYLKEKGAIHRASDQERAVWNAVENARQSSADGFVKARDLANKLLDGYPQSIIGHLAMAQVEHYGDANLPRALFEIRQARHLLEDRGPIDPFDADAREWYILALYEEYLILGDMDRRDEQLQALDLLEQVYQPMPWLRLFPLIKQKKLDDVEALLDRLEKEGGWKLRALNTRIMVAEQRRDRPGNYKAGKQTVDACPSSAVLWNNFGLGCVSDFRFEEAEKAWTKSASLRPDFHGSAYFRLTGLYLQQGRFQESLQAIKQGQARRAQREPFTLQQDRSLVDRSLASLLLALGRGPEAERFARRSFERPGRLGNITVQEREDIFSNGFLLWLALQTRIEQVQEGGTDWQAQTRPLEKSWHAGMTPDVTLDVLRGESWILQQKLVKLLGDPEFLTEVLRPHLLSEASADSWAHGSILKFLPAGVAEEALAQARTAESHAAAAPYFDVMAAELALARGRPADALVLVGQALEKLPMAGEKLLRARASAVGAEAAFQTGQLDESRTLARQALADFPQAFRLLGFRVPIRVEDDGNPLARAVSTRLQRSPRFRNDPDGFRVQIRVEGDRLLLAMYRAEKLCHVQFEFPAAGDPERTATAACTRFHERMTSPLLDLTTVDINALDQLERSKN
jgi:tetratricopeptide (TPR) repeat protein